MDSHCNIDVSWLSSKLLREDTFSSWTLTIDGSSINILLLTYLSIIIKTLARLIKINRRFNNYARGTNWTTLWGERRALGTHSLLPGHKSVCSHFRREKSLWKLHVQQTSSFLLRIPILSTKFRLALALGVTRSCRSPTVLDINEILRDPFPRETHKLRL